MGVSSQQWNFLWLTSVRSVGYRSPVPRQLRIEYPKAIYYLINRGDCCDDVENRGGAPKC